MTLSFTVDQFFAVFTAYNDTIWPAQIVAYALGALALWGALTTRAWAARVTAAVLALFWAWNGVAYHLAFFAQINPAAYGFAALFVIQGAVFLAYGTIAGRLRFTGRTDWRGTLGLALIAYAALLYPALGYLVGHVWPNAPVFGVAPCPTTIFTFGVLMLATGPLPVWLIAIPVIWAGIGGSAAILLGVPEDFVLLASGVLGAIVLPSWGHARKDRALAEAQP
jgi:hypothetical protein